MVPQTLTKAEQLATAAATGGGLTIIASLNDWSHEYAPLITFCFGLVAMLTGIGTLVYKFWDSHNRRQQRIRDRALEHKRMEHEAWLAQLREDEGDGDSND